MAESSKGIAMTQLNTNAANTTVQDAATVAPKKSMLPSFHFPSISSSRSSSPAPATAPATTPATNTPTTPTKKSWMPSFRSVSPSPMSATPASEPTASSAATIQGTTPTKKSWMPSFSRSSSPAPATAPAEENTGPKQQSTLSRIGNTYNTGLKKLGFSSRSSSPTPETTKGATPSSTAEGATPSSTAEGTATITPAKKSWMPSFSRSSSPAPASTSSTAEGTDTAPAKKSMFSSLHFPGRSSPKTTANTNLPPGHEHETAEEHAAHANLPPGHEHETAEEHAVHANLPPGHEHETAEEHAAHAHAHEEQPAASSSWFGVGSTTPAVVTGNVSVANPEQQEEMQEQEMQQSEGMESRGEGPNFSKMSIPQIMGKIIVVGQLYSIDNKYLFIYKGKTSDARITSGKNSQFYHDFFYIGPETNVVVPPEEAIHKHNFLTGLDFKTLRNLTLENEKDAAIKIALSPFFGYTIGKPETIARIRGIRHFYEIDNQGTCKQLTNVREGTPGGIFIYRPPGMKGPSASNIARGGFYTHFINSLLKGGNKSKKHTKINKSRTKKRM